jgi:hypothetical protein
MLVMGAPLNCGGPGIPQRIIANSRVPSAMLRTTGTGMSGKIAGSAGRLPDLSVLALVSARMAFWLLVML